MRPTSQLICLFIYVVIVTHHHSCVDKSVDWESEEYGFASCLCCGIWHFFLLLKGLCEINEALTRTQIYYPLTCFALQGLLVKMDITVCNLTSMKNKSYLM